MNNDKVHSSQYELARTFSSVRLLGPPMSDKLIELVCHLFSPDEAEVARHLPFYYPKPLEKIAKKAGREPASIRPVLDTMAERRVIYGGAKGYSLLPLIPGMFEYMLMDGSDSDWHREYGRLVSELFATGYARDYARRKAPAIRNIPVKGALDERSLVAHSGLVDEMLEAHTEFAVLNACQCRQSARFSGRECEMSAPEDGCLVFGGFSRNSEERGNGRLVDREEMREIVAERYEKKLVFLTGNVAPESPNAICTCCSCCCHYLEYLNHYGGFVSLAEPRYKAAVDADLCNLCGECIEVCPTGAHRLTEDAHQLDRDKCIGCGNCVTACSTGALTMQENPSYQAPSRSFTRLGLRLLPGVSLSGLEARLKR
ncbi:MAG: 4Fe-4S binding protein [bacterium]